MIRSLRAPAWGLVLAVALAVGCQTGAQVGDSGAVREAATPARYDPSRDLGPLFHDVQVSGLFSDSKTFADARPLLSPPEVVARYAVLRDSAGFSLQAFVGRHFELPQPVGEDFQADTSRTMEEHIRALWPVLTRGADTTDVVPGGRFREVYYWDSYFTMLGLVESDRTDLVRSMLDNFAQLTRAVGHVPNGNRTYYLSRSQPPFLAAMVGLYAQATDTTKALRYLDALETEHAFWMEGAEELDPGEAHRRVVRLSDGSLLNRYWDDRPEPRPESYREDYELGRTLPEARRAAFYRDVRAAAESGWDFSSRWMRDPADLRTLETTELVPVDLNSLLYHAEGTIAALRTFRGHPGDAEVAERFAASAERRRRALLAAAYEPDSGFFYDVRWRSTERVTDRPTLAAAAALYFGLATSEQGRAVAARLERDFLEPGGFVTTLVPSGQQWDAPNGWPPLQWLAIQGVRRYGRADLAVTARNRWLALNRRTYRSTGKMMEKYDVVDLRRRAGGGEYPTQDGFGWSNGVALALSAERGSGVGRGQRIPMWSSGWRLLSRTRGDPTPGPVRQPWWAEPLTPMNVRGRLDDSRNKTEITVESGKEVAMTHPSIRGRGAAHNPANRFDLISVEREAWTHAEDPAPETKFYRDASRSIIATNDSPDVGFDASVNPYRGCETGCSYCFARPTHEYFGLSAGIDWETKIFVKEDAPELLRTQLSSSRWEPKVLAMSGVTDPYQPVERRLGITRRCLEVLAEFRNPVVIITKNHMVTRDIDLLQRLALENAAMVNLSITTLRRSLQRVMEPRTSIPQKRLEAIRKLSGAGIPVGVLVAPVIPGLTDHEMPRILERAAEAGAVRAGWVMLRLPYAVKDVFEDWLERHFPDRKAKVLNRLLSLRGGRLNDPQFGSRMRGEGPFAEQVRQVFEVSCRKAGLNRVAVELSTDAFRRPDVAAKGGHDAFAPQLNLF
jgi:alpha,alpha-trehalase